MLKLPIYGPRKAVEVTEDGEKRKDTVYHTVAEFKFINQFGEAITDKDFQDKIYVADFFFTTCQSICPKMSMQFTRVQEKIADMDDVLLISHTVNPEVDTVEVMKDYADKMGATKGKWHLVTGEKKELYDIARHSYFITAMEGDGGPNDFIHSEKFVLVDKAGRIRGYYDGTDAKDVDRLMDEIMVLKADEFVPRKSRQDAS